MHSCTLSIQSITFHGNASYRLIILSHLCCAYVHYSILYSTVIPKYHPSRPITKALHSQIVLTWQLIFIHITSEQLVTTEAIFLMHVDFSENSWAYYYTWNGLPISILGASDLPAFKNSCLHTYYTLFMLIMIHGWSCSIGTSVPSGPPAESQSNSEFMLY